MWNVEKFSKKSEGNDQKEFNEIILDQRIARFLESSLEPRTHAKWEPVVDYLL